MIFQFVPAIQAGINSGMYEIVRNPVTGELLGIARDKATGQFVAHAIGIATQTARFTIEPLLTPPQLLLGGLQMLQTHRGFQTTYKILDTLQASVGVLQATTVAIGVGTAAGVVSAVNLYQTLKLKEEVKQMRLEVKDGFIDLKQALKDQQTEIIQKIELLAREVEFKQHHTILVQAYGLFMQAIARLQSALKSKDVNLQNSEICGVRDMLFQALANYGNLELLEGTCSAGQLRRQECVWVIEQAIAITYQLEGAYEVASDRMTLLQQKIRQDLLNVIDRCKSQQELDFLFPEIARIHGHDLAVLKSWQNHINWLQILPPVERQMLASLDTPDAEYSDSYENQVVAVPEEQLLYENLKQTSHYLSLRDQLRFMVQPDLRQTHESYINQQAAASNYKALVPSNWQEIPDLTVANLYWYFKVKEGAQILVTGNE